MNYPFQLTRRKALTMLAALPLIRIAVAQSEFRSTEVNFERLIRHRESARVIGSAFLRACPAEADLGRIKNTLQRDLGIAYGQSIEPEVLRVRLRKRRALDFHHDRTVKLFNCWLSISELRLCGLVALLETQRRQS